MFPIFSYCSSQNNFYTVLCPTYTLIDMVEMSDFLMTMSLLQNLLPCVSVVSLDCKSSSFNGTEVHPELQ